MLNGLGMFIIYRMITETKTIKEYYNKLSAAALAPFGGPVTQSCPNRYHSIVPSCRRKGARRSGSKIPII